MKIAFVGNFNRLHDEEYIARSFEMLGHRVERIGMNESQMEMQGKIAVFSPHIVLYTKWDIPIQMWNFLKPYKTVCWLFDLYFDYAREYQVKTKHMFKSTYVVTTDNGHQHRFDELGINHFCVRQGIYKDECFMIEPDPIYDVVFVGSENPIYPERTKLMQKLGEKYNFKWIGRKNTNEVRGTQLNTLFSKSKVVVGDSYPSHHYWSNRVVETLGRGGFLIHREVEGIREEYPSITLYNGSYEDLCSKIDYYTTHEEERLKIVKSNFEHVKNNYTMDQQCQKLLSCINL